MPEEKTDKEIIEEDIKKYTKLENLANSEAGRDLIAGLEKDFISSIDNLTSKYLREKPEILLPIIAEIDIALKFLRMFLRASDQKQGAIKSLKDEEKRLLELEKL